MSDKNNVLDFTCNASPFGSKRHRQTLNTHYNMKWFSFILYSFEFTETHLQIDKKCFFFNLEDTFFGRFATPKPLLTNSNFFIHRCHMSRDFPCSQKTDSGRVRFR